MNDTTRDELIERIAELADQFACGAAGEPVVYALHGPMDFAEEVIEMVTAARDEEIRERLLSDRAKNASAHEMQELSAQGVTHNHTLAFYGMKAALDAIGLHGDGTGGQG